jgi:hypothetical protein
LQEKKEIKAGLGALGDGFKKIAAGVNDCHLEEVAVVGIVSVLPNPDLI